MFDQEQYPNREAINPRAFALRHLIVDEVKRRKLSGSFTADEVRKLDALARSVSVSYSGSKSGYEIALNGKVTACLENDHITLFLRGDSESAAQAQKDLVIGFAVGKDLILEKNRATIRALVDELLPQVVVRKTTARGGAEEGTPRLRDRVDDIRCRLCNASASSLEFTPLGTCEDLAELGDFSVIHCKKCENAFTHPMPKDSDAAAEITPDVGSEKLGGIQKRLMDYFLEIRATRVIEASESRTTRSLLDIGSGACVFANEMAKRGLEVTAIEPNSGNARFAAEGVAFIPKLFTSQLFKSQVLKKESFDVVTSWHSLEHVPDPLSTLSDIRDALKPGGLVYICVPNIASLQAKIGGNRWAYLDVPHHLSHFTQKGLTALLEKAGFEVRKTYLVSLEYEIFGFHQTILNIVSFSHNYFYNKAKKGKVAAESLRYPRWTKVINALNPLFLPLSGFAALLAVVMRKPSCVEIAAVKKN